MSGTWILNDYFTKNILTYLRSLADQDKCITYKDVSSEFIYVSVQHLKNTFKIANFPQFLNINATGYKQ